MAKKFKKGSPEAKRFMAKLRAMRNNKSPRKISGAKRKYKTTFELYGNYGGGWEYITGYDTRAETQRELKNYQLNQPQYSYKIKPSKTKISGATESNKIKSYLVKHQQRMPHGYETKPNLTLEKKQFQRALKNIKPKKRKISGVCVSGLNELVKEREVLIERIGNMESAIKHLRGSIKLYPTTAHNSRADIIYYKERLRIRKAELKSVNRLIQKELKKK
jgi:hypothetical protein